MPGRRQDIPPQEDATRRGVEEVDISTGETIGTGPETADPQISDPGDAAEPEVPEDAKIALDPD